MGPRGELHHPVPGCCKASVSGREGVRVAWAKEMGETWLDSRSPPPAAPPPRSRLTPCQTGRGATIPVPIPVPTRISPPDQPRGHHSHPHPCPHAYLPTRPAVGPPFPSPFLSPRCSGCCCSAGPWAVGQTRRVRQGQGGGGVGGGWRELGSVWGGHPTGLWEGDGAVGDGPASLAAPLTFTMLQRTRVSKGNSIFWGNASLDGRLSHLLEGFNVTQVLPLEPPAVWARRQQDVTTYLIYFGQLVKLFNKERPINCEWYTAGGHRARGHPPCTAWGQGWLVGDSWAKGRGGTRPRAKPPSGQKEPFCGARNFLPWSVPRG